MKALINTLIIAFVFLIATNGIGLAFALALNRTLRTRHFLRVILFAPVVLSPLAVSYIWKFIFQQKGPLNEFLGARRAGFLAAAPGWAIPPSCCSSILS